MKPFRIPLAGPLGLVLWCAVAFAALRSGSELWFRALYTTTVGILVLATFAAKTTRGDQSAFWFGFAVFGWAFTLIGFGFLPRRPYDFEAFTLTLDDLVNSYLMTTTLLKFLHESIVGPINIISEIGKYGNRIAIGHLLLTLVSAVAGGVIALGFRRVRPAETSRSRKFVRAGLVLGVLGGSAVLVAGGMQTDAVRARGPYFPDLAFSQDQKHNQFVVNCYAKHLEAMQEPVLRTVAHADRKAEVYRVLWLPSFHHPVCARIEKRGAGTLLTLVVLDGSGGYKPGEIAVTRTVQLSEAQWDDVGNRLKSIDFWNQPTRLPPDGTTDGDELMIEAVADGKYHIVDRHCPTGAYADVCRWMIDLSGFDVSKDWEEYHR